MSSENFSKNNNKIMHQQKATAEHGDFYFANFVSSNQEIRKSPVFIVGSKDHEDLIICSCTKSPPRTDYDVLVQLKLPTSVRTNKIYTIRRDQLAFKIPQTISPEEYKEIINKLKDALHL